MHYTLSVIQPEARWSRSQLVKSKQRGHWFFFFSIDGTCTFVTYQSNLNRLLFDVFSQDRLTSSVPNNLNNLGYPWLPPVPPNSTSSSSLVPSKRLYSLFFVPCVVVNDTVLADGDHRTCGSVGVFYEFCVKTRSQPSSSKFHTHFHSHTRIRLID